MKTKLADFLNAHPDFSLLPISHGKLGLTPGYDPRGYTARIWPHRTAGEGHFVALLEKTDGEAFALDYQNQKPVPREIRLAFENFHKNNLQISVNGNLFHHNRSLYSIPDGLPSLMGLRVTRSGWYLGEAVKDRFTPSQALAMGISMEYARFAVNLSQTEAVSYIKGESFTPALPLVCEPAKPWVLVNFAGYPLGWAKWMDGRLKNNLPAGWVMK
jgi:NOL1/NOP2/fmu family ribosome biogenesis protein